MQDLQQQAALELAEVIAAARPTEPIVAPLNRRDKRRVEAGERKKAGKARARDNERKQRRGGW